LVISNRNSFRVLFQKLLPHILFEKNINILSFEMASPGNRHCASCIGTLSFAICSLTFVCRRLASAASVDGTCTMSHRHEAAFTRSHSIGPARPYAITNSSAIAEKAPQFGFGTSKFKSVSDRQDMGALMCSVFMHLDLHY